MTENRDRPEWLVPIFFYLEASSKQPQTGLALLFLSVLGTRTLPTGTSVASPRGEEGFYWHFGTATQPTGASEASQCGEASSKQPQIGFSLLSLSVLGTGTPSPGTSETSPRGEEGIYRHFGTGTLN